MHESEKLAKILDVRERKDKKSGLVFVLYKKIWEFVFLQKSGAGAKLQHQLCLQSEPDGRPSRLSSANLFLFQKILNRFKTFRG